MKTFLTYALLIVVFNLQSFAQPNPVSFRPDVTINHVMDVNLTATRLDKDPITGELYYSTVSGNIYKIVRPFAGAAYDTLVADSNLHLVTYVQGMCFHDSSLFISGNQTASTPLTRGVVARGRLQPNGSRIWNIVALSDPYETADYFDHLFSGSIINSTGDSIYICSGARGDHGEIQTRYGLYPGIRNKSLTSCILKIPIDGDSLIIPDDSVALDNLNLVLCRGIRNTYDFAYNGNADLFGAENSGDRDMDDELNWIRSGRHYGFPWIMGSTFNPQQFPGFDSSADVMINHTCTSWQQGFFTNDSLFPAIPNGLTFTEPCKNYGPDGDQFRDSTNGMIKDASDLGISVSSFTAHRSPLGLVFDTDSILDGGFRGTGFVTCYTRGDSAFTGYSTLLAPFGDPGEDILHLEMTKDLNGENYSFQSTRIAGGFPHPVDMVLDSNVLYLIQVSYGGTASLWSITLPGFNVGVGAHPISAFSLYPNPTNDFLNCKFQSKDSKIISFTIYDLLGNKVIQENIQPVIGENKVTINVTELTSGFYVARVTSLAESQVIKFSILH